MSVPLQTLFVTSLFLPTLWRFALVASNLSAVSTTRQLVVFSTPLVLVTGILLVVSWNIGPDGFFIPILLAAFWLPQLAGIAFFFWCDHETHSVIENTATVNSRYSETPNDDSAIISG